MVNRTRKQRKQIRLVSIQPKSTPYREKVKAKILKACRGRFVTRKDISEAVQMPVNSVRSYLYYMARSGELEAKRTLGTKYGQAYRTRARTPLSKTRLAT